jgi:hypothetical protein
MLAHLLLWRPRAAAATVLAVLVVVPAVAVALEAEALPQPGRGPVPPHLTPAAKYASRLVIEPMRRKLALLDWLLHCTTPIPTGTPTPTPRITSLASSTSSPCMIATTATIKYMRLTVQVWRFLVLANLLFPLHPAILFLIMFCMFPLSTKISSLFIGLLLIIIHSLSFTHIFS